MSPRRAGRPGALALAGLLLLAAGCESTQSRSAKLERTGGQAFEQKGLSVKRQSKDLKIVSKTLLSDRNGAAVVAVVRNTTKRPLARVPVAIDVAGARKRSVFRNDDPGIEQSLAGLSLMRPGETIAWVHDQVLAVGPVKAVSVKAGDSRNKPPRELPEIEVGKAKLVNDPTSGVAAEGKVRNRSEVLQKDLVVFGVAFKGGRVVAAGRSQVERLKPGRAATYQIFFIGNPRGARIQLAAPPTVLG